MDEIINNIVKKLNLSTHDQDLDKNKNYAIICDRVHPDYTFKSLSLINIAKKKKIFKTIIFTESKKEFISKQIFKASGLNNFYQTNKINFLKNTTRLLFLFINALWLILFKGFNGFIKDFKIFNVKFGDLIYDQYARYNHNFARNNHLNKYFIKELIISINKILNIKNFLDKKKVSLAIIGQHCYANNSIFIARLIAKKKTKCFLISGPNVIFYKDPSFSFRYPFKVLNEQIKALNFNDYNVKKIYKKYLIKRNAGKLYYLHDNINSNFKKNYYKAENLDEFFKVKANKIKKKILFAAHVFADGAHACGNIIFKDYFEHFEQTINFFKDKKDILLIIKPHPSSHLLNEEGFIENYFKKNNLSRYKNIQLAPKDVKIYSLIDYVDNVTSCSGTAALETAAFFGKKPILAGQSYFSDLGFTLDCKSKERYFFYLENLKKIKRLTKSQQLNANKTIYIHECQNNWKNFGGIFPPNLRIFKKKKLALISNQNYLSILSKNLKKKYKFIHKDTYFIFLKKLIKDNY